MDTPVNLLEIKDLNVGFDTPDGQVSAVNNLNVSIKAGDALAIVGESGSGKTQTVMAIMGLLAENGHASGQALFKGKDLLQMTTSELNQHRGREIAMIFQDPMTSLNPVYPVGVQIQETLILHRKMDKLASRKIAIDLLDRVGIREPQQKVDSFPHTLSGGQRQQVAVGRALMTRPQVLMLDEPTAGVSPIVMDELFDRIVEIARTGITILIVEQNARQALGIADKGYVLVQGQNRFTDTGEGLLANEEVRQSFLGG